MPGLPSIKNRLHTAAAFFLLLDFCHQPGSRAAVDSLRPSITPAVIGRPGRRQSNPQTKSGPQALLHSESTRVYHLAYRGFPGDRGPEMTVEATYDSPSTKT